jgi:hypothetical protein
MTSPRVARNDRSFARSCSSCLYTRQLLEQLHQQRSEDEGEDGKGGDEDDQERARGG